MERNRSCEWNGMDCYGRKVINGWINLLPTFQRKSINYRAIRRCNEIKCQYRFKLDKISYSWFWILGSFKLEVKRETLRNWENFCPHSFPWRSNKEGWSFCRCDDCNKFCKSIFENASEIKSLNDRINYIKWQSTSSGRNQIKVYCRNIWRNRTVILY